MHAGKKRATKSPSALVLNLIASDSGACFLDPMQSEISRNRSNRELHWTLGRKLLQAALNWTTIRLQQYEASQSESLTIISVYYTINNFTKRDNNFFHFFNECTIVKNTFLEKNVQFQINVWIN